MHIALVLRIVYRVILTVGCEKYVLSSKFVAKYKQKRLSNLENK